MLNLSNKFVVFQMRPPDSGEPFLLNGIAYRHTLQLYLILELVMTFVGVSRLYWLLGTSVLPFDVLRLIERAFLPKCTTGKYNHYGSECIDFLPFCLC